MDQTIATTRAASGAARRAGGGVVLIAGASCAGKTCLIERIQAGDLPALAAAVGVDSAGARFYDAIDCDGVPLPEPGPDAGPVVLHYDIFRPLTFYGARDFAADPVLAAFIERGPVRVATLWAAWPLMAERARRRRSRLWHDIRQAHRDEREIRALRRRYWRFRGQLAEYSAKKKRRDLMRPIFQDPARLAELYDRWFAYCDWHGIRDHWLIDTSSGEPDIKVRA